MPAKKKEGGRGAGQIRYGCGRKVNFISNRKTKMEIVSFESRFSRFK